MTDIETLRNELSELDLKIIELVHRRQVLSEEIGAIKRKKGRPTRDYQTSFQNWHAELID